MLSKKQKSKDTKEIAIKYYLKKMSVKKKYQKYLE